MIRHAAGLVLLAVVLLACSDASSSTGVFGPQAAVAGRSGCFTVATTQTLTATGQLQFAGPISGDLEGTAEIQFASFTAFTGVTNTATGSATWTITGGIIPELIGATFVTDFENRNILLPGTQLAVNVGTHRAASGVDKANLTYRGETSLVSGITQLDHRGVICPN